MYLCDESQSVTYRCTYRTQISVKMEIVIQILKQLLYDKVVLSVKDLDVIVQNECIPLLLFLFSVSVWLAIFTIGQPKISIVMQQSCIQTSGCHNQVWGLMSDEFL